jgi:hypothetical protein
MVKRCTRQINILLQGLAMSSYDPTQELGELITFSWYDWHDGHSNHTRITTYSMVSGELLTNFSVPLSAQLENDVSIRMDRNYIGATAWGDDGAGDIPTVYLLQAGLNVPLFNFTSPGR